MYLNGIPNDISQLSDRVLVSGKSVTLSMIE